MAEKKYRNFGVVINCDDMSIDVVQETLDNLPNLKYGIGQEENSHSGFHHLQLMLCFKNPRQLSGLKQVLGERITVIDKDPAKYWEYCRKLQTKVDDGWAWQYGELPRWSNAVLTREEACRNVMNAETRDDAIEAARLNATVFVTQHKAIMGFIDNKFTKPSVFKYKPNDFLVPLQTWEPRKYCLVFIGPSGIGKTNYACAHFTKPVIIGDKEDYKNIKSDTDGIILDDVATADWKIHTLIKWLDGDQSRTMNVKYSSAVIPQGMKRIICLNDLNDFWPRALNVSNAPDGNYLQDLRYQAIVARIIIHMFSKDLRKNPQSVCGNAIKLSVISH